METKRYNKMSTKIACIESIPQGHYCYDGEGICPYWSLQEDKQHQENGYCHFLQKGDGHFDGLSLIWDQVKECNIFREINEYEYSIKNNVQTFFKRILLFKTINGSYSLIEKIKIVFNGKILRCKFCNKYFLRPKDSSNLTQCTRCFFKRVRKEKESNSNE